MKDYNLLTRHKQKWTYLTAVKLIKANPRGVVTLADLEKELNTYSVMSFMQWDDAAHFSRAPPTAAAEPTPFARSFATFQQTRY
jgi:hypothetical protein